MAGPVVLPGAERELEYFMRLPWCRDQFLEEGALVLPRLDQETDGRGSTGKLLSEALNTPTTISHRIVLIRDPPVESASKTNSKNYWLPLTTCSVFYALGEGVCGFGDICHGGIQTTLLDDVMGVLGVANARLQDGMTPSRIPGTCSPDKNPWMLDLTKNVIATQGIQVQFLRPLCTPAVIQVAVHLEDIEDDGSSFRICGVIKDGKGKEYAEAEARWVVFRSRGKL
ncbi:hypothetical protein FDECE_7053 [Fusarium decemcellulare]|nr:hypothetical protein FDECE_7053 [Fusarium decemcellulare]